MLALALGDPLHRLARASRIEIPVSSWKAAKELQQRRGQHAAEVGDDRPDRHRSDGVTRSYVPCPSRPSSRKRSGADWRRTPSSSATSPSDTRLAATRSAIQSGPATARPDRRWPRRRRTRSTAAPRDSTSRPARSDARASDSASCPAAPAGRSGGERQRWPSSNAAETSAQLSRPAFQSRLGLEPPCDDPVRRTAAHAQRLQVHRPVRRRRGSTLGDAGSALGMPLGLGSSRLGLVAPRVPCPRSRSGASPVAGPAPGGGAAARPPGAGRCTAKVRTRPAVACGARHRSRSGPDAESAGSAAAARRCR